MRILLTNPTLHYSHGHKFLQSDWPSLTLPYLAAIMGKHDVRIVDHSHSWQYRLDKEISNFKPDLIAFSIIAGRDIPSVVPEIEKIVYCWKIPVIAGGQGASYNADKLKPLKVKVFKDEGEKSIPYYLSSKRIKKFDRINLDHGPMPRWDLMPKTRSLTFRETYTGSIEMSRGCPFKCEFCAIANFWHSFRQKSVLRIVKELFMLSRLNRRHIYLADDSFGINAQKHMELFDMISESGFHFFTQIRADTVANNPKMIKMAAKAGLYGVLIGFDSYDDNTLAQNNKTTKAEINIAAARILRENKIAIVGSHIYGLPGIKSFEKTYKYGRKNSDIFAMPYFDGRPKIQRPKYDPEYAKYVRSEQFSTKSIAYLFHPNKAIRTLKRGTFKRWWHCSRGFEKERIRNG